MRWPAHHLADTLSDNNLQGRLLWASDGVGLRRRHFAIGQGLTRHPLRCGWRDRQPGVRARTHATRHGHIQDTGLTDCWERHVIIDADVTRNAERIAKKGN